MTGGSTFNRFWACLVVRRSIVSEGAVFGFFCLRNVLEYNFDTVERKFNAVLKSTTFKDITSIPIKKLLEYDVEAAVRWLSQAMFDTENSAFGKHWARAIAVETDLWSGEQPGLSIERWRLWKERLDLIAEREDLDPSMRKSAGEAARMIVSFDSDVLNASGKENVDQSGN